MKMEARDERSPLGGYEGGSRYGPPRQPLRTREERVANFQRYQARRSGMATAGRPCFYCYNVGHFVRDCPYKREDRPEGDTGSSSAATANDGDAQAGNESRA